MPYEEYSWTSYELFPVFHEILPPAYHVSLRSKPLTLCFSLSQALRHFLCPPSHYRFFQKNAREFLRYFEQLCWFDILQYDSESFFVFFVFVFVVHKQWKQLSHLISVNSEFVVVLWLPYFLWKLRPCLQEVWCCWFVPLLFEVRRVIVREGRYYLSKSMSYSCESLRFIV